MTHCPCPRGAHSLAEKWKYRPLNPVIGEANQRGNRKRVVMGSIF